MPRYFMKDTRLAWAERMMMDPSRTVRGQHEEQLSSIPQKRGKPAASARQGKETSV